MLELGSQVWAQVCETYERAGYDLTKLTPPEQATLLVLFLDEQVRNGGFHQYYFNSTGNGALLVAPALREIGAPALARIVERANRIFPGGLPDESREIRCEQLDYFTPEKRSELDECDDLYYRSAEDIEDLVLEYYRKHSSQFTAPPPEQERVRETAHQILAHLRERLSGGGELENAIAELSDAERGMLDELASGLVRTDEGLCARIHALLERHRRDVDEVPEAELDAFPDG